MWKYIRLFDNEDKTPWDNGKWNGQNKKWLVSVMLCIYCCSEIMIVFASVLDRILPFEYDNINDEDDIGGINDADGNMMIIIVIAGSIQSELDRVLFLHRWQTPALNLTCQSVRVLCHNLTASITQIGWQPWQSDWLNIRSYGTQNAWFLHNWPTKVKRRVQAIFISFIKSHNTFWKSKVIFTNENKITLR